MSARPFLVLFANGLFVVGGVGCVIDTSGLRSRDGGTVEDSGSGSDGAAPDAPAIDGGGNTDGGPAVDAGDAGADTGAGADAGPPVLGPFGEPTQILPLAHDATDDDPTLPRDRLELYFNSNRSGSSQIWVSRRASTADAWGAPVAEGDLNSPEGETSPEIAPDGLTMWLASRRGGRTQYDIFVATRPRRTDRWSTPTVVTELSGPTDDTSPGPAPSLQRMVLGRDLTGSNDLFEVTRPGPTALWGVPVPIATLNTATFNESNGCWEPSELRLWLDWNDTPGGDADIHVAERPTLAEPFARPVPVAELNTTDDEHDPWISEDLRHVVFVSDRTGNAEIWEASR